MGTVEPQPSDPTQRNWLMDHMEKDIELIARLYAKSTEVFAELPIGPDAENFCLRVACTVYTKRVIGLK